MAESQVCYPGSQGQDMFQARGQVRRRLSIDHALTMGRSQATLVSVIGGECVKCILLTCKSKLICKKVRDLTLYLSYVADIFFTVWGRGCHLNLWRFFFFQPFRNLKLSSVKSLTLFLKSFWAYPLESFENIFLCCLLVLYDI